VLLGSLKHEDAVSGLHFSDDGQTLTTVVRAKKKAVLWDLKTMKQKTVVNLSARGITNSEAYSRNGRLLLTRSAVLAAPKENERDDRGDWVRVWDLETDKEKMSFHSRYLWSSVLSPDGKLLAVIEHYEPLEKNRQDVKVLDVDTGKELYTLPERVSSSVFRLDFSPDSKTLALSSVEREYDTQELRPRVKRTLAEVRLWDFATQKVRATLTGSVDLMSMLFSPDSKTLVTWASNQTSKAIDEKMKVELKLWDVNTGKEKVELKGHTQSISAASFSPDGKLLAAGGGGLNRDLNNILQPPAEERELKLWDVTTGKEHADLSGHTHPIHILRFSPNGSLLASSWGNEFANQGELRLWDVAQCVELRKPVGNMDVIGSLVFSPDSKAMATGGRDGVVRLWDVSGLVINPKR
jgi:WD40 repeat protein